MAAHTWAHPRGRSLWADMNEAGGVVGTSAPRGRICTRVTHTPLYSIHSGAQLALTGPTLWCGVFRARLGVSRSQPVAFLNDGSSWRSGCFGPCGQNKQRLLLMDGDSERAGLVLFLGKRAE